LPPTGEITGQSIEDFGVVQFRVAASSAPPRLSLPRPVFALHCVTKSRFYRVHPSLYGQWTYRPASVTLVEAIFGPSQ